MIDDVLVTVGIPTYNRPNELRKILSIVTSQTYRNLEIIVSDNCSDDEENIRSIVESFQANDTRIKLHRQKTNLGAVLNFQYLVNVAQGELFLWAPDDDDLEPNYVQMHVEAFRRNPKAVVVMAGYDVIDRMQDPEITTTFTKYLLKLPAASAYMQMRNFISQPEYKGKIRISWGAVYKTKVMRAIFDRCLETRILTGTPKSFETPLDLRLLAAGELIVLPNVLSHVNLMPTSNGRSEVAAKLKKIWNDNDVGFYAYQCAVEDSGLTRTEKNKLLLLLNIQKWYARARILPYYGLAAKAPNLARKIKNIWFGFLGKNS